LNFGFTEEQDLLRKTARDVLAARQSHVREILDGDEAYSQALWKELAELGWTGLVLPEAHGGAGLSIVELCIVLEELGSRLTPVPLLSSAIAGASVLDAGDDSQREAWLPKLASGDCIGAWALPGEGDAELPALVATEVSEGISLSGSAPFVPDAGSADLLLTVGRQGDDAPVLFAVARRTPGVRVVELPAMDRLRRVCRVDFEGAVVPRDALLAGAPDGPQRALDRALVMLSAEMVGGAGACLETSVAYAKERIQFGKPIGVHQAIKHKCADMLFGVESARAITYYAAWAACENAPDATVTAAMAKATASDSFRQAAQENLQIHGGVGFTWEYDCHLYLKRAKTDEAWLGDAAVQRRRIADLLAF
jgi:alkylation response protein AidB-like acyl-CoA dehydrogenase